MQPGEEKTQSTPAGRQARQGLGPGIRLGKLFGVAIRVDVSLFIIFALVLVNLGLGVLPHWHPGWSAALRWGVALFAAVSFFASILLHELSHALVGRALGVSVSGITLFLFGGMAHLDREPKRATAELWMALVGPVTSFAIGFTCLALGGWLAAPTLANAISEDPLQVARRVGPLPTVLLWLGPINILLAVFNLLPGFPLDGGRVLRALIWWKTGDVRRATRWATMAGMGLSWLMISVGVVMAFGLVFPVLGGGLGQGLWFVLIGWFLNNAARASYTQLVTRQALEHVHVSELMWLNPEIASPGETVSSLVRERVLHGEQRVFPVVDGGTLLGAVRVAAIRDLPEPAWPTTSVAEVMTPRQEVPSISPEADATEALRLFSDGTAQELPVVRGDHLVGLVRRQDLLRWLSLHTRPGELSLGGSSGLPGRF